MKPSFLVVLFFFFTCLDCRAASSPSSSCPSILATMARPRVSATQFRTFTNIPPRPTQEPLPENFNHFVLNSETGQVREVGANGDTLRSFDSFTEFAKEFNVERSFFPMIFDTQNPGHIIFGIGEGSITASGEAAPGTLVRNGGHFQLASRYRGSPEPDRRGLVGGGIKFNEGTPTLEFRSRSINGSATDGALDEEQELYLRNTILPMLK
jgi:hypothetical protein